MCGMAATTKKKSFKDQPWSQRFQSLGDEAEKAFEAREKKWARSGWNRPEFTMNKMPKTICYMPDYVMDIKGYPAWVEVQGCGQDQLFKFKDDKLAALKWWQGMSQMKVYLWLWDATNERVFFLTVDDLWAMTVRPTILGGDRGSYPEGKSYVALPTTAFVELGYGHGT